MFAELLSMKQARWLVAQMGEMRERAEQEGRIVEWETGQRFDRDTGRLYALFDTRDFDEGHVMVKWRQRQTGEEISVTEATVTYVNIDDEGNEKDSGTLTLQTAD